MTERLTVSIRTFAEMNEVTVRTVERWIANHTVKSVKIGGNRRIVLGSFLRKIGEVPSHYASHRRDDG